MSPYDRHPKVNGKRDSELTGRGVTGHPDPEGIITGGHDNKTARTVAVRERETINAPAISAMFKQITANNRAGHWHKLKRG